MENISTEYTSERRAELEGNINAVLEEIKDFKVSD
jgi:hypothetical protein